MSAFIPFTQTERAIGSALRRFLLFLPSLVACFSPTSPLLSDTIQRIRSQEAGTTFRRLATIPHHSSKQNDKAEETRADEQLAVDQDDVLTSQELKSRFEDVLAHYRETKEMTAADVCHSMLLTRLPKLELNRCTVAKSTIEGAGFGLFATRDIFPGELITCFPGDALLIWSESVGDFSGDVGVKTGRHIQDVNVTHVTSDVGRSYELKIGDLESLVADPTMIDDAAYLGHMANDKLMLVQADKMSREYYAKSTVAGHNAAFFVIAGCHLATTATKRISKDEEIFVSYGEGYWKSRISETGFNAKR